MNKAYLKRRMHLLRIFKKVF